MHEKTLVQYVALSTRDLRGNRLRDEALSLIARLPSDSMHPQIDVTDDFMLAWIAPVKTGHLIFSEHGASLTMNTKNGVTVYVDHNDIARELTSWLNAIALVRHRDGSRR